MGVFPSLYEPYPPVRVVERDEHVWGGGDGREPHPRECRDHVDEGDGWRCDGGGHGDGEDPYATQEH